jgi:hypothetical protein
MSRESGSERSQRTVAELLAQYGANSEDSAPRRRRRRADEPSDTSPQTIIDRVLSDSGEMMAIRDDVAETTVGAQPPVRPQQPQQQPPTPPAATSSPQLPKRPIQQPPTPGPQQQTQPPTPPMPPAAAPKQQPPAAAPQATATGMRPPMRPGTPPAGRTAPPPPPRIESSRTNLSRNDLMRQPPPPSGQHPQPAQPPAPQQAQPTGYFRPTPPGAPTPPPVDATADTTYLPPITGDMPPPNSLASRLNGAPPQEGVTDVMPRIPAVGESTQAHPGPLVDDDSGPFTGPGTQAHPGPLVDDDDDDYEYDYQQYAVDRDAAPLGVDGALDVDEAEDDEQVEGSPAKQWLMMIAQLAIGVVGGAALWLGFQWLWNALPAAALAAAVAVIVALVIVVRRIRKADDLQTMVLAVLVGLIVTVSPAALRLIGH